MSDDCLFCRILAGEVPSTEVLSTDSVYAFRDVAPTAPTHVLVIPRRHIEDAAAIQPDDAGLLAELIVAAQRIAAQEGVADSGYRLVLNCQERAGQTVPHLHLHLLGGRDFGWPPG